ncbi:MAG: S8 family serine peptidase [Ardenticatenaceae bacterium]|nr:S8 family serine peptidase [Ardenticatenaceae bacterium]MCB8972922.1 S8 family serine peptidase [Ardenticatenaceae bacterium]
MRYLTYLARFYLTRRWLLALLLLIGIVAAVLEAPLWLLLLILLLLLLLILFRQQIAPNFYPQEEYLVPDQVILSGPTAVVNQIIETANRQTNLQLEEVHDAANQPMRLTFGSLPPAVVDCLSGCYEFASQDFVIVLVRLGGARPDVSRAIRILQQLAGGNRVRVEPNWLTGSPWDVGGSPWDVGGSPWDVGGSPWDVGGSPWDVGGSPWDVGGSSTSEDRKAALPAHFLSQWAFRTIELGGRSNITGQHVRVGIFDTSPYPDTAVPINRPETVTVDAPAPKSDWNLEVVHPKDSAKLQSAIPAGKKLDVRDHGLFVAGLVNAVAPDAEIRLCRVLGSDNRGDLFLLLRELFNFLLATADDSNAPATIINLSLGIRIPPKWVGTELPREVQLLQLMMQLAHCLNVTVVAAAGNDSAKLDQPERPNLPALWPNVIGVAASNQQNGRSCFSNQGDIAAPGGDGGTVIKQSFWSVLQRGFHLFSTNLRRRSQFIERCQPTLDACADEDCPTAIIGPVLQPVAYNNGVGRSNYIFWHGSSFAAPMVTGLAALVQQRGNGQLTPSQVRKIIECGATPVDDAALGAGIINVRQTLAKFDDCARELGIVVQRPSEPPHVEKYPKNAA